MILLLAGTAEARHLAQRLTDNRIPAIASLAGATREPAPLPLPTRIGGFGGTEGFTSYLDTNPITAVIDATHPFAARITARTHAICTERGLPHLRLERPAWTPGPGDRWIHVADEAEATRLIPENATVFLATGRQSLPAWADLRAQATYLRVIDPPTETFPLPGAYVVARPPFDRVAEADLFHRLAVTHLVVKDAGGADSRPKLDAARDLGIEVLILRRPEPPEGLPTLRTVDEALAWAVALSFSSA
ncbi:Cobalt-precorrin-6x reductase [Rubellimicrobium mesophilum DSM 19309]|uniref:Cobalt-precorrin-6x reductase n=1 Tax=Rubellimicrobium mesophilum DSM 19309 TaxID=442562 RepID=A0A017HSK7_9RHOB|nr:cobalt-precorrin-6A reductase [Rubellimicrobium mesophilum]EYD76739.1 Cobalt-precorrin-6x reductase [Rubellimicrobium mesophilum DSM 19309]